MNAEDKQDILDFIDFYVVLGIVHQKTLCKYLGISVRTIQRWRKNGTADKRKGSERKIPRKLKPEERRRIYQELCSPEYKDLNPNEIYNSLLDKGIYLASSRTFYRILKEFNAIYHRTEDRKGNSKKKPDELKATAPNQVWMWDIRLPLSYKYVKHRLTFYIYSVSSSEFFICSSIKSLSNWRVDQV